MPETRSMSRRKSKPDVLSKKPAGDPLKRFSTRKSDPLKRTDLEEDDPLKHYNSQDVLKRKYKPYKAHIEIPEVHPFNKYFEFKPSNIDPLTGKPRRKRQPKPEVSQPKPKVVLGFPPEIGSSVESVKRQMRIVENLDF